MDKVARGLAFERAIIKVGRRDGDELGDLFPRVVSSTFSLVRRGKALRRVIS